MVLKSVKGLQIFLKAWKSLEKGLKVFDSRSGAELIFSLIPRRFSKGAEVKIGVIKNGFADA